MRLPRSLHRPLHRPLHGPALLLLASVAQAQWSSDPAQNLAVADAAGDQILPKLAPTPDGGTWVSWFDALANGFDVRVQKLDSGGNEVFAHGGILVLDRGFSSVQDYGLDVDAAGHALLAFRDDSGANVQITAARVSPGGTLVWGAGGVQLTATAAFVAAPKIAGTSDGGAVVAWTQDVEVRLQKLDSAGNPLWAPEVVLTPGVGSYAVSDLHDAATDAILGFVHQIGGFGSPRHVLAQKLDSTGSLLWGAGHVTVFDGGSLQFGNFPPFVPDGAGGAVFAWYDAASAQLQCHVQRLTSAGAEVFPHDGVTVSTDATRVRVSPAVAYAASTSETFAFWTEQNAAQSQSGLYGQKLDASGVRQWGAEGSALIPLASDSLTQVRTLVEGSGAFVAWDLAPSFGTDVLRAARVNSAGAFASGPNDAASTASGKSRLAAARSTAGFAVLAWSDDRDDAGDVLAQNVNTDGSLGPAPAAVPAAGSAWLAALLLVLGSRGARAGRRP